MRKTPNETAIPRAISMQMQINDADSSSFQMGHLVAALCVGRMQSHTLALDKRATYHFVYPLVQPCSAVLGNNTSAATIQR
jgi:hypothetical protein